MNGKDGGRDTKVEEIKIMEMIINTIDVVLQQSGERQMKRLKYNQRGGVMKHGLLCSVVLSSSGFGCGCVCANITE